MNLENDIKLQFSNQQIWKFLGIEILEISRGYSRLVMPFDEKLTQVYGLVHGGAMFTLADSAVAIAVASTVEPSKKFVTVEMKINFLEAVIGGAIEAKARVLRTGRVIPAEVEVTNADKLVAKAIATYIILGEKKNNCQT